MKNKGFNLKELSQSLTAKMKAAKTRIPADGNRLDVYVEADLTDDELWVLAHSKVNNDRTSMEWEGFYIDDLKAHANVKRRYESLKKRIEEHKETRG